MSTVTSPSTHITPPNPTVHYTLSGIGTAIGIFFLLLASLGVLGVPGLANVVQWPLLISLFFLIPGIAGLVCGEAPASRRPTKSPARSSASSPTKTVRRTLLLPSDALSSRTNSP